MERRGWIDYRRTYPGRSIPDLSAPRSSLLEPDRKSMYEEKTSSRTVKDEESGPGEPGEPPERKKKGGRWRPPWKDTRRVVREPS